MNVQKTQVEISQLKFQNKQQLLSQQKHFDRQINNMSTVQAENRARFGSETSYQQQKLSSSWLRLLFEN